jgi:hypothetical protein
MAELDDEAEAANATIGFVAICLLLGMFAHRIKYY